MTTTLASSTPLSVATVTAELRRDVATTTNGRCERRIHESTAYWILSVVRSGRPDDQVLADIRVICEAFVEAEEEQFIELNSSDADLTGWV